MARRDIDELVLLDIEATNKKRGPRFDQIEEFTRDLYCPVAYGGGIRDMHDINTLIKQCGVDKVIIKTNDNIIPLAVNKYGAQSIVYALDIQNNAYHGFDAIGWAKHIEYLGVGEIILTDIDHQGMMQGYNNLLINNVSKELKIPLVANGGCGGIGDMVMALSAGASAVAASSVYTLRGLTPQDVAIGLRKAGFPARVSPSGQGQDDRQRPRQPRPDDTTEDT